MASLIIGSSTPVETGISTTKGERDSVSVVVEGPYSELLLKAGIASDCLPSDYDYLSHTLASTGDGMGKLTVNGIKYTSGGSFDALRTSFNVDMLEVTYDLEDHPYMTLVRDICVKWVSDGCIYHDSKYYTKADSGEETEITDDTALKFCRAYSDGIKTFNRYFPVISKISYYSNPPGLNMSGSSFSGGSPQFSANIGTFENPPISLDGYPANHWFKSKDSWEELAGRSWRRTEQWTYTPDASIGEHAWIYTVG